MKRKLKFLYLYIIAIVLTACSVETESHIVETPVLELKANGPLYQGSNTATATWHYSLDALFPEIQDDILIENVRVSTIKIIPKDDISYPKMGQFILHIKPKNAKMTRVGLLKSNFKNDQANSLNASVIQENFNKTFKNGQLTFTADFDLIDQKYKDDLSFDLIVTFKIYTRK